jgi:outer membrane protein W
MKGEGMKRAAVLMIALVILTAFSAGVSAQKGTYWLSLPLSVVVPTGDLADVSSTGWGLGFGVGYWITDGLLIDGQFAIHNFGEKKVADGVKVNGAIWPIELGVAYYFLKDKKYRPYVTFRTGYYNFEGDFRDEGELGQKNKPGNSLGLGLAFVSGYEGTGMLFIEPNVYALYGDETYMYWTVNFGVSWNIGG